MSAAELPRKALWYCLTQKMSYMLCVGLGFCWTIRLLIADFQYMFAVVLF